MTDDTAQLPEYADNPFIACLPALRAPMDALGALTEMPVHAERQRQWPAHVRTHCVLRLGRYFDPNERHVALEQRLGAMIRQGYIGRNPLTTDYVHRLQNDFGRVKARDLDAIIHPVESTAAGMSLIGVSGMGKTRSVKRILRDYPQIIEHDEPFALKQVVWMHIDSPSKGSPRQLCVSFFEEMDRLLGTNLFAKHGTGRRVLDEMIVQMAAAANRHALGLLVIDEIQHLTEAKGTDSDELLNFLVTLVNKISVPVMIIGTPKSLPLLQGAFRQARRASGLGSLVWDRMKPGRTWDDFVDRMWARQWTRELSPLTEEVRATLYDESQGVVDVVVKLYMLAQIRVIQHAALVPRRVEIIDAEVLRRTAHDHLALVQPMLDALRRNDAKALALYDDLTDLQYYVDDVVSDILADVTPRVCAAKPVDEAGTDLLLMLERLGVPLDVAVTLLEAARAEAPDASDFDLIGAIHAKLHQSPPAPARSTSRKSRKTAAPTDPLLLPENDADGYAAFATAGLLRRPSDDMSAGAPEAA